MADLKVIHINAHGKYSTGNIATSVIKSVANGSKLFHTCDALDESISKRFYSKSEWMIDVGLTRIFGLDSIWSWNNTRKIIRDLKREKPDILHLHNLHGFYINYRALFKFIKKHNVKVVWTLHDCWSFTGHCSHFDFIGCDKWKTGCHNCSTYKKTYLKSWFFDRSKAGYKSKKKAFCGVENMVITTPSEWLAGLVKQSFLKEYPVKVVNNGISTENFNICENVTFKDVIPNGKKVVLAVASSWDEMKGYSDVVEISRKLSDDYIVVMVGVSEALKQRLSEERIIAISKTENQRGLAEIYSAAHVFINTTYQETFPTVNIEALCCGCPIITYATGGSVETVNDANGVVVPKGDVDAMLGAIYGIKDKEYNRQKMSEEAKKLYSKQKMIENYIKLYKELL